MIQLDIEGAGVRMHGSSFELEKRLSKLCSFWKEGAEWTTRFQSGKWDGYTRLFKNATFPVGLLNRVKMQLFLENEEIEIRDKRPIQERREIRISQEYALRPYQDVVYRAGLKWGNGLIRLPTGGGKTVVMGHLMAHYGTPALVMLPTVALLEQTQDRLESMSGIRPTLINTKWMMGEGRDEDVHWAVATWQALHHMAPFPKWLADKFGVFIADEAHIAGADKVSRVCLQFNSKHRFGMSATPWRLEGDELRMYGAIGEPIKGVTCSELIDLGWLVPPKIQFIRFPEVKVKGKGWQKAYKQAIVENMDRNIILMQKARELADADHTVLIMVQQIPHGLILKRMLEDETDLRVEMIDGTKSKTKRRELTHDFAANSIPLMISSSVWNQGVDFPNINAIVLAGPYRSQVANMQRIGRGLRLHPGKTEVVVVDTMDSTKPLRDWSMERRELYEKEPRFAIA